jgi:hypothetical protein
MEKILLYTMDRIYCETQIDGNSQRGMDQGILKFKEYVKNSDIESIINYKDAHGNNILHKILEYSYYDFYEFIKHDEKTKDFFLQLAQSPNKSNMTPFDLLKSRPDALQLIVSSLTNNVYFLISRMMTQEFYDEQYNKIYDDMKNNNYKSNYNDVDNILLYLKIMDDMTENKMMVMKYIIKEFTRIKKYKLCLDFTIIEHIRLYYKDIKTYGEYYLYGSLCGCVLFSYGLYKLLS